MIFCSPSQGLLLFTKNAPLFAVAIAVQFPLLAVLSPAQNEEAEDTGMMPAKPQSLFAALPGKLENWKLTRSTAEGLYSEWLQSRVVREYERQLPAEEGEAPPPLSTTRISITDTGRHASAVSAFADFEPGKEEGFERKYLDGDPAYLIESGESEFEIEMLVAGRFIIRIISRNQPESFLENWLKRLDRKKLRSLPDTATIALPETILISHIDQLDPEKNRAYQLATSSSSRVSAEVEEDEAWLKQVLGEIPAIPDVPPGDSDSPVR
jgi:hypothetical protein